MFGYGAAMPFYSPQPYMAKSATNISPLMVDGMTTGHNLASCDICGAVVTVDRAHLHTNFHLNYNPVTLTSKLDHMERETIRLRDELVALRESMYSMREALEEATSERYVRNSIAADLMAKE